MELKVILMFLLSLMLTVISSWSLGTFMRLNSASKKYNNNKVFESACQLSKEYVVAGVYMGVVITIISFIVLTLNSYDVYKNFKG
jgi:hypothetical protein